MKSLRIISIILVVAFALSSIQIFAFAEDGMCSHKENTVTVEFHNEVSENVKEKVIAHFNGDLEPQGSSRGLTCSLFGHKIETGTSSTITHKVKSTAPRCLKETYQYEVCSRCDEYSQYTLLYGEYIYCC